MSKNVTKNDYPVCIIFDIKGGGDEWGFVVEPNGESVYLSTNVLRLIMSMAGYEEVDR